MTKHDRVLGCIIGGAIGDALGRVIEFKSIESIIKLYGPNGVTYYDCNPITKQYNGLITDDTQLILFTIDGLMRAESDNIPDICSSCYKSYLDWYCTQTTPFRNRDQYARWTLKNRLLNTEKLFRARAPGNTMMGMLGNGLCGSTVNRVNDSKGSGTIMKIAPVGLKYSPKKYGTQFIIMLASEISAMTHGHNLGILPASFMTVLINEIVYNHSSLDKAIADTDRYMRTMFGELPEYNYMINLCRRALKLAKSGDSDVNNIHQIGAGFVAEETLAIALYCVYKYQDNFEKAVLAAVNHNGDSDTVASVTGNIMGTLLGYDAIPKKFFKDLELMDLMTSYAEKLE